VPLPLFFKDVRYQSIFYEGKRSGEREREREMGGWGQGLNGEKDALEGEKDGERERERERTRE